MPVLAPIIPSHFSTANLLPPPSPAPICCEPILSLPRYCSEWLIPWCSCWAPPRQRGGSCPHSPACRCSFAPCTYPLPCSQPRVLSTRCASPRLYMVRRVLCAQHCPDSHSPARWPEPWPQLAPTVLLPALSWRDPRQDTRQDPPHSPCPVVHCLHPLHCSSRHQRRANCPKISQEGGRAGKAPLNTHTSQRGTPGQEFGTSGQGWG